MEPKYPFRPFIGPGTTTITGNPNNPFGGRVTDQNTNMVSPEESPEQTIVRLAESGLAVDQIAELTGLPNDQVAMVLQPYSPGFKQSLMPQPKPQGIGTDLGFSEVNTTQDLENFVDSGKTVTDLVRKTVVPDLSPGAGLTEGAILLNMEDMGVDLSEEEAEALDAENDPTKKAIMASTAGAIGRGADDEDTVGTFTAMTDINSTVDPEDRIQIYKDAAASFYNVDDIKELISKPDEGLPFLIAGAALIQSGEKGESWATALSGALSQYSLTKKKGQRDYDEKIAGIDIQKQQGINQFAMNMYMADIKDQRALSKALLTADRSPYKVGESPNPEYLTDSEVAFRSRAGEAILPWRAEDGATKEYTLFKDENLDGQPDNSAPAVTKILSAAGAQNAQKEGFIVRDGNLTKNKKMYMVDGKSKMFSSEELDSFLTENPNAKPMAIGTASVKSVIEKSTGQPTFVSAQELMTARGRELYTPINANENMVVFGPNGEPVLVKGDGGLLTKTQQGKEKLRITGMLRDNDIARNNVIRTRQSILDIYNEADRKGAPLTFGTAGALTGLGKRVIDEVDQMKTIFTDPKAGYSLYTDKNGNGQRDPGEDAQTFDTYSKQFDEKIANSNLGKFLLSSGLSRKRVNSLVLTLALQSAATDNQKSRDISDKDMDRYLTRAGAYATSQTEFLTLIDDLTLSVMQKHESVLDGELKYAAKYPDADGTYVSMIDSLFPNIVQEDSNSRPFRDAQYTVSELKEQLKGTTDDYRNRNYTDPQIDSSAETVLPGGNEVSGVGKQNVHEIYMSYKMAGDSNQQNAYLAQLRKELGQSSAEYQTIKKYIESQLNK